METTKWKNDYESLFRDRGIHKCGDEFSVDDELLRSAQLLKQRWENEFNEFENCDTEESVDTLNDRITQDEITKCIEKSKSAKSHCFDLSALMLWKTVK